MLHCTPLRVHLLKGCTIPRERYCMKPRSYAPEGREPCLLVDHLQQSRNRAAQRLRDSTSPLQYWQLLLVPPRCGFTRKFRCINEM